MKKIFVMMFIALTAVTTVSAQRKYRVDSPTNVINVLNFICDTYGQKNSQVYSVNKNPNTGIIESKEVITPFVCKKTEPHFTMIADYFHKDEPVSYQLMHIANGNLDKFSIKVATGNGSVKTVGIRTQSNQEMWYMAVKNQDNPQLRDVYAIVWENRGGENVEGRIFMITSLRPDLFEKDMEKDPSKPFMIDGRMGEDINDSLYVFYMADTYEELNKLTMMTNSYAELREYMKTHNDILPMPVRNNRFNVSVDINKRMGGRIRTVMPDGSLCKLWTNIDMVPGETYHITTHNGYYMPDSDYEHRVGLYTSKSMFIGRENDDVEMTGGYNDVVADTDSIVEGEWEPAVKVNNSMLTSAQQMELERKAVPVNNTLELINGLTEGLEERISLAKKQKSNLTKRDAIASMDNYFDELIKLNTKFDKHAMEVIKTASSYGIPKNEIAEGYKDLLDELSDQNKIFNELYKHFGYLSKKATKCQKHINMLMEKYMNEISTALAKEQ